MKIDRPLCPEGFGEPYVHQPPATLLQRARRWLDDLTRAEGHPNLYAPAQRLTRGARGRTMTRRGLLALALAAGGAITAHPAMAFFRGGGGVVSGGVTLLTTTTRAIPDRSRYQRPLPLRASLPARRDPDERLYLSV